MISKEDQLEAALLDLAWGQWCELGVPGTVPSLPDVFIDLEALVVLTAELADIDPRLRDESVDWLSSFERYVSRSRIRHLSGRLKSRENFDRFLAGIAVVGRGRWPRVEAEPMPVNPAGGRASLADLGAPALLQLRMRAIFGVGARAEILRVLGWQADGWLGSAMLARLAGYTKRNTEAGLDSLKAAGLVQMSFSGNRMSSRLANPAGLFEFVGAAPERFVDWGTIVPILLEVRELRRRREGADPRVRDVPASGLLDGLVGRRDLADFPGVPKPGPDAWARLMDWAVGVARLGF